jgi:hypothetical protein
MSLLVSCVWHVCRVATLSQQKLQDPLLISQKSELRDTSLFWSSCHNCVHDIDMKTLSNDDASVSGDDKSDGSMKSKNFDQEDDHESILSQNVNKVQVASIAANESKAVRWIRVIAIAVITFSTLGVALGVFYYMTHTEKKTFAYRFKSDSYKILESIGSTFDRSLGSVDAFAVNMVSSAKESNQTWPFVTLSDFPVKSSKLLTLSKGVLISPYFYVTHDQRPLWNKYAEENNWWVEATFDVQEKAFNRTYFGSLNRNWTKPDDIWSYEGTAGEHELYCVGWQQYPVAAGGFPFYSWDYLYYLDASGKRMHETHQPVISSAFNLPDPNNPEEVAFVQSNADWFRDYVPPDRDPAEPYSDLLYVSYDFSFRRHARGCGPRSNTSCPFVHEPVATAEQNR